MIRDINNIVEAKAIAITQPLVDFIPNAEGILSYAARVSSPNNQTNFATADKLLKYCARNGHWSVFETCNLVLEIKGPRDITRQLLRHHTIKPQEFSQRYAEVQEFCLREARLQDSKNRQNSIVTEDDSLHDWWLEQQYKVLNVAMDAYTVALERGIAKECARSLLPEGMTMSNLYMNGNIRSWIHYCKLRTGNGTQKEHVQLAQLCKAEVLRHFPSLEEIMEQEC